MKTNLLTAAALSMALVALPVSADSSLGAGFSLSFGGGKPQAGVGVRLFSSDKRDKAAASVGMDYILGERFFRPTFGAAWMGNDTYLGADVGFGIGGGGGMDFGLGLGVAQTQ
jgi:hypothetical protein